MVCGYSNTNRMRCSPGSDARQPVLLSAISAESIGYWLIFGRELNLGNILHGQPLRCCVRA